MNDYKFVNYLLANMGQNFLKLYHTIFVVFIADRIAFVKVLNCHACQDNLNSVQKTSALTNV